MREIEKETRVATRERSHVHAVPCNGVALVLVVVNDDYDDDEDNGFVLKKDSASKRECTGGVVTGCGSSNNDRLLTEISFLWACLDVQEPRGRSQTPTRPSG